MTHRHNRIMLQCWCPDGNILNMDKKQCAGPQAQSPSSTDEFRFNWKHSTTTAWTNPRTSDTLLVLSVTRILLTFHQHHYHFSRTLFSYHISSARKPIWHSGQSVSLQLHMTIKCLNTHTLLTMKEAALMSWKHFFSFKLPGGWPPPDFDPFFIQKVLKSRAGCSLQAELHVTWTNYAVILTLRYPESGPCLVLISKCLHANIQIMIKPAKHQNVSIVTESMSPC